MRFASPLALLLLLLIPVALLWRRWQLGRGGVAFPSVAVAAIAGRSWRQRLSVLPVLLRSLCLILLILALARPQEGWEQVRDLSQGVAIEMVVDRSGSMRAEMKHGGRHATRLDVVKDVFEAFVLGNNRDLDGRRNDLIGLVAFARHADTVCPLTLGHGALVQFFDTVNFVQSRSEDGTAIGDAVALAAARLQTVSETLERRGTDPDHSREIKSKVIILLTDGENNCGKRTPEEAAELAAEWGVKIYAIGVGGDGVSTVRSPFGTFTVPMRAAAVDETTLRQMAARTGGLYRLAKDARSLRDIYAEIDRLERSDIEAVKYMDYRERFAALVVAAVALLGLEAILQCTVLRRIP